MYFPALLQQVLVSETCDIFFLHSVFIERYRNMDIKVHNTEIINIPFLNNFLNVEKSFNIKDNNACSAK